MTRASMIAICFMGIIIALGGPGCSVRAEHEGSSYRCDLDGRCPPGYECISGLCQTGEEPPVDAAVTSSDSGMSAAGACGTTHVLTDDFSGGAFDRERWQPWTDKGTIRVENGAAVLEIPAGTENGGAGARSLRRYWLDSSGVVIDASVSEPERPVYRGLSLEGEDGDRYTIYQIDEMLVFERYAGALHTMLSSAYSASQHRYWQIREEGGLVYGEASMDGISWQRVGMFEHTLVGHVFQVHLWTWANDLETDTQVFQVTGINDLSDSPREWWCPGELLVDDFDDDTIDPLRWSTWGEADCTATEQGGQVWLASPPSGFSQCRIGSRMRYDMRNSVVAVEVPDIGSPAVASFLELKKDEISTFALYHNDGMLYAQRHIMGLYTGMAQMPYDAVQHRWWRFRSQDTTLYWETSADGQEWQPLASHAGTEEQLDAMKLILWSEATSPGTQNASARFDSLNVYP